ncbi:MAG TPA: PilC/PilY family type IV pilus protein [Candidatus Aminicenantes bacterium]|nr:PilC/PilY family type IV pilus protein [Candidatus Aminicenantes bacterium]HRY64304.1 PilC/PilY family type IV pilus protein [Candidatus Aminicenantes bacterium]HRZ71217.1 PilC/PilY family type IV pilus protein [Candidatus Aminicenantes bacterium]
MKRQGSLVVLAAIGAIAAAAVLLPRLWPQVQNCTQTTQAFTENFNGLDYKDTANSSVDGWTAAAKGPITLPVLGSNFAVGSAASMGGYIYAAASGDFTGDGYPDLVGLEIGGQVASPRVAPYSQLVLVRNQYATNPDEPLAIDWTEVYDSFGSIYTGPACITVGDYNHDGLLDFFFMRNSSDQFGYTNFLAKMYINTGTATNPNFSASSSLNLDFSSSLRCTVGSGRNATTYYVYNYWATNHLASVDIDKDGDTDILMISQDKVFLLRQGSGTWRLAKWSLGELSYGGAAGRTGYSGYPGGSAIAAADFDGDGDIDVICGSVGTADYLVFYQNDGKNVFTRSTIAIPNAGCYGVDAIMAADFTNDGRIDVFVATDAMYRRSIGLAAAEGRIWFLRNETVNYAIGWTFKCLNACVTPTPDPYDIDIGAYLDIDNDGDMDVVICDANHSGDYYLVENQLAGVFALYGQGVSTNVGVGILDPSLHAVTQVRVTDLAQHVMGGDSSGLAMTLYFSNNGGRQWEFYKRFEGSEITNASNLDWYEFKSFGADLRWKAVLTAAEDTMDDYDGASYQSPAISSIAIEYIYVDRLEYSRASAAATVVARSGTPTKLVISASFIYPGDEGQLRAYNVTNVSIASGTASQLYTLSTSDLSSASGRSVSISDASILWDAGQLLADRAADARTIYTAVREDADLANPLVRTEFTVANEATLGPLIDDVQNDNAGLIEFIRGVGRDWKLGDINRSTPVVVGPPSRDAALMGDSAADTSYADFKTTYANRSPVVFAGANDGMLHCFDVLTGEELWAFIPYNLLPKLKEMYQFDAADPSFHFFMPSQTGYVDATPAVADVQISGAWRTVLVCGQGPGSGSVLAGGLNYYWALDVTDPLNPQPLWEITHTDSTSGMRTMGETRSTPAIGKISVLGLPLWVAFMGSGYDNDTSSTIAGTYFYTVRIDTGEIISALPVAADVDTSAFTGDKEAYRYTNIAPAIVAGPAAVDNDSDGYVEYVYVADLDGRVYRLDASVTIVGNWALTPIYVDYLNYPISTRPAVWLNPYESTPTPPRVYFGTGGHDRNLGTYNPGTDELAGRTFSFVGLIDGGPDQTPSKDWVEWYIGDPTLLGGLPATKDTGDLGTGYKVWADPVLADNIIYFSTLSGSIEAANPCTNLGSGGQLYGRYVRQASSIPVGGTAFRATSGAPPEYLQLQSKARQSVTVGEAAYDDANKMNKRDVYVQEYNSTIEQLVQPIGSLLRVKSWREVYQVIR